MIIFAKKKIKNRNKFLFFIFFFAKFRLKQIQ